MERKVHGASGRRSDDGRLDEGFYIYHVDHVRRRLRQLGITGADMDDLVQQTFFVAQRYWDERPVGSGRQRAWLTGIAWRIGMNFRRLSRANHALVAASYVLVLPVKHVCPEAALHSRQICRVALASMTYEERTMLRDYFVEGVTIDEVAERQGISRSTAWSKLQRLRKTAAKRLAPLVKE